MGKFVEDMAGWFKGEAAQSKNMTKYLFMGSLGIAFLLLGGLFSNNQVPQDEASPQGEKIPQITQQEAIPSIAEAEKALEQRLQEVLGQIEGVGQVTASVSLASTKEQQFAVNTVAGSKVTNEKDPSGGSRVITESTDNDQLVLVHQEQGSRELPVVIKESKPEIQGVVVVAEGAADPWVKADLAKAVQTLLNVPAHKVSILAKESR